jgi:hypothetical protein
MLRILLSYRREDSAPYAGRLYDHLSQRFGRDNIFMDVATIKPGQDFFTVIEQSVASCDVLVAVIGKGWLTSSEAGKGRRLDQRDDFVRLEIAIALKRQITVIPALVGGAAMPQPEDLPDDLDGLSRRQAIEISDTRFHEDVDRLIESLPAQSEPSTAAASPDAHHRRESGAPRRWLFALAALVVAAMALAYWLLPARDGAPGNAQDAPPGRVTTLPSSSNGTIDNPRPIDFGTTYMFVLDQNEEAYLKPRSPAREIKLILDAKRVDGKMNNLINTLSILDGNGAAINERALHMNEIDTGFRQVGSVSFRQPTTVSIKLLNSISAVRYWLTIVSGPGAGLTPFYGEHVPTPLAIGQTVSGELDENAEIYYAVPLKRGDYTAILDFSHPGRADNLLGYLAVLDADGGNQRKVIGLNELGVSYRAAGALSMRQDHVAIIRIGNQHREVNYSLRITPKE